MAENALDQHVARAIRTARNNFFSAQEQQDEEQERRALFVVASLGAASLISDEQLRNVIIHTIVNLSRT